MSNPGVNQIARNIHDGIAQDLVALGYSLDQALGAPELPTSTRLELRTLRFGVTELIEKVRREILQLRSTQSNLETRVLELVADRIGKVDLKVELDQNLYPIVLELIRNAVNHSGASVINLTSRRSDASTIIEVSDNGSGVIEMKEKHFGLTGVIEQINERQGKIEYLELNPGLMIRVSIPI